MLLIMSWYYGHIHKPKAKENVINLLFGIVTAIMYLDDYLMLHELFVPYYLGLPEISMVIFYFLFTVVLIVVFYKELLKKGLFLILASCGFLGFSAIIDTIFHRTDIALEFIFEDGSKMIGILLWALFALYRTQIAYKKKNEEIMEFK